MLSSFFCQPGDHNYSVGASHLHVRGGNGVLLPLLCRLYFVPLPLSMQEEAESGKEGKLLSVTVLVRPRPALIMHDLSKAAFVQIAMPRHLTVSHIVSNFSQTVAFFLNV